MGGLIILLAILVPVLLFARLRNIYIILMLLSTVWLGLIGFLDDYIKIFRKNKEGLSGRFKVLGQIGLGITVGWVLFYSNEVQVREYVLPGGQLSFVDASQAWHDVHRAITTVPFMKNNELNYGDLFAQAGTAFKGLYGLFYIPIVVFLVTAISNGANLTDGLDGLAAGIYGRYRLAGPRRHYHGAGAGGAQRVANSDFVRRIYY
nr:hypothetical protein [Tanacetum cinerariifolium]